MGEVDFYGNFFAVFCSFFCGDRLFHFSFLIVSRFNSLEVKRQRDKRICQKSLSHNLLAIFFQESKRQIIQGGKNSFHHFHRSIYI